MVGMGFWHDIAFLIAVGFISYKLAPFVYNNFSSWPAGKTLSQSIGGSIFLIGFGVLWNFAWGRPSPLIPSFQVFDGMDLFFGYLFFAIIIALCVIELRSWSKSSLDED
jgi:hypothetical protein